MALPPLCRLQHPAFNHLKLTISLSHFCFLLLLPSFLYLCCTCIQKKLEAASSILLITRNFEYVFLANYILLLIFVSNRMQVLIFSLLPHENASWISFDGFLIFMKVLNKSNFIKYNGYSMFMYARALSRNFYLNWLTDRLWKINK